MTQKATLYNKVIAQRDPTSTTLPALEIHGLTVLDRTLPGHLRGFNALSDRVELKWVAGVRGVPQLNAVMDAPAGNTYSTSGLQAMFNADPEFEVLGTNAVSTDVTRNAEGGITVATHGASGDSTIILPHLNSGQSAWTGFTWGTDQQTCWECELKTGSAITATTLYAGLKLTNTDTVATDNDQVFFRYQNSVSSGAWEYVYSIGGTDTETATSVTVAASTVYHLKITIDSSRIARFYINGHLVGTSTALTDATDLIPYAGIKAGAAAVKSFTLRGQAISRVYA